ncbi:hypothetical protein [Halovivax limisalsi]|uniref:hypothetical protein n=1 Tax=Halovivax limisalsi TaxID=1453760 RepID=UPI001FFC90E6|nr:hypothetical protein [Halovivax limisalsi]
MNALAIRRTARNVWSFYRGYVDSPVHALSAALLAIFRILVFVDPLFAILAIAAYVIPPIVLFSTDWSARFEPADEPKGRSSEPPRSTDSRSTERGGTGIG